MGKLFFFFFLLVHIKEKVTSYGLKRCSNENYEHIHAEEVLELSGNLF